MHASDRPSGLRDRGFLARRAESSRILIVEDDLDLAELIRESLSDHGHDVAIAETVREARRLMRDDQRPFDLVISDVRLPRESGVDLLFPDEQTRSRPRVLMMTAFVSVELKSFVEEMGAGLLEKPFSLDMLNARVTELLR
jgi:DNA-binding response OmpR family regulator